jgi:hypothetical protein
MIDYIEFSKKIKDKYPQYKDVDDLTLAKKVIEKYPQYKERVTFEEVKKEPAKLEVQKKNIDLTPSGLAKNAIASIGAAPIRMALKGEDYKTARENALNAAEKNKPAGGLGDFLIDLGGYSALPVLRGGGVVRALGNAAIQGGVPGAIESLKRGGNVGGGAAMGTGIAGLLQTLPYVGKGAKFLGDKLYYNAYPGIKADTVRQLVKPNSKALDLTNEQADRLALDTLERFRGAYKELLNEKGATVGNLLEELPTNKEFKSEELSNLYDSILNNYSLSKNQALNPARNATSRELEKISDLLYGDGTQNYEKFSNSLKDLEFPKGYLDTVTNRYKNTYHKKVLDNLNNDIEFAQRNFNNNIIEKMKKDPSILQNPEKLAELEKEVGKYAKFADDDLNNMFYDKFYEAVKNGEMLESGNTTVNPKELYDINKNINNMIDWDKSGAELKNDVLEQLYLANAKKISDLSPELKAANKAYSDLLDYKKGRSSRLRTILNPDADLENATSKLKNYKSTNDDIFRLEKQLIDETGAKPFLNDIDDVNAAKEYLESIKTGFNPAGITDKIKLLEKPLLLAHRKINQVQVPNKLKALMENIKPIGKVMPYMGAKAGANLLYGGVEYNDYQN